MAAVQICVTWEWVQELVTERARVTVTATALVPGWVPERAPVKAWGQVASVEW